MAKSSLWPWVWDYCTAARMKGVIWGEYRDLKYHIIKAQEGTAWFNA